MVSVASMVSSKDPLLPRAAQRRHGGTGISTAPLALVMIQISLAKALAAV